MLQQSNLQEIDFGKLYKEQKSRSIFKPKNAHDWDIKASEMNERVFQSMYTRQFLQKVELQGAKTLLDVGSGPGTLGISLASKLEKVYCLDFSNKMIEHVKKNARKKGLSNVQAIKKSFEQSWDDVPQCDILIASRCMEVVDLENTIKKLIRYGKKIYITYNTGGSFVDKDIINELSKDIVPKPDYIYLINILYNLGFTPSVSFIESENTRFFTKSKDEFMEKITWSLGETTEEEQKNLSKLYEKKYSKIPKNADKYQWAFISFDTLSKTW